MDLTADQLTREHIIAAIQAQETVSDLVQALVFVPAAESLVLPGAVRTIVITGAVDSTIYMPADADHGVELTVVFDAAQTPIWLPSAGQALRRAPAGAVAAGFAATFVFNTTSGAGAIANCWYCIR